MDPGPADTVSTVSDLDESLFKREKACLVCSQAFNSAAMVKHSWYSLPSKICHHAVCMNCSKGTVHDPKTKRQVRACNHCYKDSFVKREDHKQQLIEEQTQLVANLQEQADRERELNKELSRKLLESQESIRKLEIATRGENLEIMQELQLKLDKKKKKREALQAKLDSNAAELRANEGRIETTQRTMGDLVVQMQEAWEREKEDFKAQLEALEGRIGGRKGKKGSLIRKVEEEKRLQEDLISHKSDFEAKITEFQGKNQSNSSEKAILAGQIDTLQLQVESLQQELAQYQAKCKEHESSVDSLEALKVAVASLISERGTLQEKVTLKEGKINGKREENVGLEGKVRELEELLEAKRTQIAALGLACRTEESQERQFSSAKEAILEEIQKAKDVLYTKTEEHEKAKQRLSELNQSSAARNSEIATHRAQQDQCNSQIAHFTSENTQILSEMAFSAQSLQALSTELKSLHSAQSLQDQSLLTLQSRLADVEKAAIRPIAQGKCCRLF